MAKTETVYGELIFLRTREKGRAVICVYRGESTFTLSRVMKNGLRDELTKPDPYDGDTTRYIEEATLNWSDLERDGVVWKPHGRNHDSEAGEVRATF